MRLSRFLLIPLTALPLALAACDNDPDTVVVPQATQPPSTMVVPDDDVDAVIVDPD